MGEASCLTVGVMKLLLVLSLWLWCSCDAFALRPLRFRQQVATQKRRCTMRSKQIETPYLASLLKTTPVLQNRFFFPGHGGVAPSSMRALGDIQSLYTHDVPELEGTDNIHCPTGPLLQALQHAAKLFGARKTWFLVNGSSSGVMMAIFSCVRLHQRQMQMQQQRSTTNKHSMQPSEPTTRTSVADSLPIPTPRSIFMVGRDAHKSVFDALSITQDCDAVLLPCALDTGTFQVSLGVTLDSIQQAIHTYGSKVCLRLPSLMFRLGNTIEVHG